MNLRILRRVVFCLATLGPLAAALLWFFWRAREPVYQGKTLTAWLYNSDPDFVWMPNDIYGHIHNELWDAVVAGGYAARERASNQSVRTDLNPRPDAATEAVCQIGTNAIPCLLRLMAARPTMMERSRDLLNPILPGRLSTLLYRARAISTADRRHYAAMKGFSALGTNAEAALPALSDLLQKPEADFELGSAIASIGTKGRVVLVNALANSDNQSRRVASFCLGLDPEAKTQAVPLLVSLVELGKADYQVLGAIGRLGGEAESVIPALTKSLDPANANSAGGFDEDMAIMILGLYREKSQAAIPILLNLYTNADKTTRQVIRVAIKNIDPRNSKQLLGRASSAKDDEDPWWNGAQD